MKHIVYTTLLLLCSLFLSCGKSVKLDIALDQQLSQDEQWVYWFSNYGNEYNIVDSCLIQKGQTSFSLQGDISTGLGVSGLTFSKRGPNIVYLILQPGEHVKIHIANYSNSYVKTDGSEGTNELYDNIVAQTPIEGMLRIAKVRESFGESAQWIDSIALYEQDRVSQQLDFLKKAKVAVNYYTSLVSLEGKVPTATMDSLVIEMKRKFKDIPEIESYPEPYKYSEPSDESFQNYLRMQKIIRRKN